MTSVPFDICLRCRVLHPFYVTDQTLSGSFCSSIPGKIFAWKNKPKISGLYRKNIENIAGHASETERRAETIEREIAKLKMTEYMTKHIGEIFEGRISGVTSFGMFVELPNTIEGLVKLQDMKDDYYNYDPEMHHHIGERSGKIYRLGQDIKVMVAKADINLKQIDFEIDVEHFKQNILAKIDLRHILK